MANELEQRAREVISQIDQHIAWRKGCVARVPSDGELREWSEVVAALQQVQQPSEPMFTASMYGSAEAARKAHEEWKAQQPGAQAVACDDAAVERALAYLAFEEDGAQWPDAYSEEEQAMERETMRGVLAAANCATGPSAYCRACQAVGMGNCQHFDECSGATCITCHQPLNTTPPPPLPEGVSKPKEA